MRMTYSNLTTINLNTCNLDFMVSGIQMCSELVDYTRSYLQTDKFGLHFGLDRDLYQINTHQTYCVLFPLL